MYEFGVGRQSESACILLEEYFLRPRRMSSRARLEAILRRPDNAFCVDCGARGPRWSSVKLGIFLCPQCAGIHRKLGTHITFVQSVSIDKWKPEWVDLCDRVGNRVSNDYFEANVPGHMARPTPSHDSTGGDTIEAATAARLEKWLRNKYELKLFVLPGSEAPATAPVLPSNSAPASGRGGSEAASEVTTSVVSKAVTLPVSPPPSPPSVTLPTNWASNVFLSSWANANNAH